VKSNAKSRQRGAALLLMMLVVLVAASATLLKRLNSGTLRVRSVAETRATLQSAKQGLMNYALVQSDLTGAAGLRLPCPDLGSGGPWLEGESHTTACGAEGETMIGRLPWRTLGTKPYHDGSAACLWYVVSGTYKDADAATLPMLNPDNNGQLQLYSYELGSILAGAAPAERPVAMIIAPSEPLQRQSRNGALPSEHCSTDFSPAAYLDADAGSGISNAVLSGTGYSVEQFVVAASRNDFLNDQIQVIGRSELAGLLHSRHDFDSSMRMLGQSIAECVAAYGKSNPGGADDRRLPWPAPVSLPDYSADTSYDDAENGDLSGRLAERVDNSNGATGNGINRILANCDPAAAPSWQPADLALWQHWKDHFFYAVAESFQPTAAVPSVCADCLTVNGAGDYAAIVFFAGSRLDALQQIRNAPPLDTDSRHLIDNYLERQNASNHPYSTGTADYSSASADQTFNDIVFCIDDTLSVTAC